MRISLLVKREPFGNIFAQTLKRYWRQRHGLHIEVAWGTSTLEQRWWGNSYLNFFANAAVKPSAFEVLRREYSHSRVKWRRPIQSAYVSLATRHPYLRWLSDITFSVSPALPATKDLLILGGNHRLRLLAPADGRSTVILKEGFASDHLTKELQLRTLLNPRCAPKLFEHEPHQGWFEEEYFAGTPINRIPRDQELKHQQDAAMTIWQQVVAPTLSDVPVGYWTESLLGKIKTLAETTSASGGVAIVGIAARLASAIQAAAKHSTIPVAWTHGDLQEANIVVNQSRSCVIDWEAADIRFAAYDFFQLATGGRWTDDAWVTRVVGAVNGTEVRLADWLASMPEMHLPGPIPVWWGLAYVLEELWFRAREGAESIFYHPGAGWPEVARSAELALVALEEGRLS